MEQSEESKEPRLNPIFNGWAAHGDGWAVHGQTQEEAVEVYWRAEQRRRELLAMRPRREQVNIQSACEENRASTEEAQRQKTETCTTLIR
jgi:hypothetical protein